MKKDLKEWLREPEGAAGYLTNTIFEKDWAFLPTALGEIAKAHGISRPARSSGIHRRTLYKVFDQDGHPSFELVIQVLQSLGLEFHVRPRHPRKKKSG